MALNSYGSEGEFIGKTTDGGSGHGMQNGNGNGGARLILDALLKFSSLVVYPIFVMIVLLYQQNSALDKRLSLMEDRIARPIMDVQLSNDIAIIKDRQTMVMKKVDGNDSRIDKIELELESHRMRSTYDPAGINRKYQK